MRRADDDAIFGASWTVAIQLIFLVITPSLMPLLRFKTMNMAYHLLDSRLKLYLLDVGLFSLARLSVSRRLIEE